MELAARDAPNGVFIDRFSAVHFGAGVAAGAIGLSFQTVLATAIAWEFVEPNLKRSYPKLFPKATHDTNANKVGDIAAAVVGWWFGRD